MPLKIEITPKQHLLILQGLRLLHAEKLRALAIATQSVESGISFKSDDFGIDQINKLINNIDSIE